MRYYDIKVYDAPHGKLVREWTSLPAGGPDPNALNAEFDMIVAPFDTPLGQSGSSVRIWGVALEDIGQAQQFQNLYIEVYGGMQQGLPLANPAQAGMLLAGTIYQAWGNWIGTDMTLDLLVIPAVATPSNPANITFQWQPGQQLADAIKATLATAFPQIKAVVNIAPQTVPHTESGYYATLPQFAWLLYNLARVRVVIQRNAFLVFDATTATSPVKLAYTDLIGQPTWIDQNSIQIQTVMRADLQVNDVIKMPQGMAGGPGSVTTLAQSLPNFMNYKATFQGSFLITNLRHVGNFRASNGAQWCSIFNCIPK